MSPWGTGSPPILGGGQAPQLSASQWGTGSALSQGEGQHFNFRSSQSSCLLVLTKIISFRQNKYTFRFSLHCSGYLTKFGLFQKESAVSQIDQSLRSIFFVQLNSTTRFIPYALKSRITNETKMHIKILNYTRYKLQLKIMNMPIIIKSLLAVHQIDLKVYIYM